MTRTGAGAVALMTVLWLAVRLPSFARQEPSPSLPVLGAPADFEVEPGERVMVEAGTALRREPSGRSPVLVVVDAASELEVVGREGEWTQVRYEAWRGWIRPDPSHPSSAGLFERPLSPPSAERIAQARVWLGGTIREYHVGDYGVLTDLESERLLAVVGAVLQHADSTYVEWFGLDPGPPIGETIVVFARRESYRQFRSGETGLGEVDPAGHAGGGLAAIHAQDREEQELGGILMHEMVHLLNRRALRYELPAWLEEGLATALSWAQRDGDGRTTPETFWEYSTRDETVELNGSTRVTRTELESRGPCVDLARLVQRHRGGMLPSLAELFAMPTRRFLEPGRLQDDYVLSAAVVRFLLEGEQGRWREGFERFLADDPRLGFAGSDELSSHLGVSVEEIEQRLWRWLARLVGPV